jgi:hypothetical protein
MGMRKGVPDLVILHSGRIMSLEVKSPGGTLSRERKEFRVEWERAGGIYTVVRSVEEGTRPRAEGQDPFLQFAGDIR